MQLWQHCQHRSWDARLVFDLRAVFGRMQICQSRMQEELLNLPRGCKKMRIRICKHGSMDEASLNHGIRSGYTSGGMEHMSSIQGFE